jgi:hypothetical protein
LSFQLLLHYFHLSLLPHDAHVTKRFYTDKTRVLTFADDAGWLRALNSALILIEFLQSGNDSWSFARLGTHCLENFFGLVRQNARGDDRFIRAIQIIAHATAMVRVMHELNLHPHIRGRDNVGGTIIGPGSVTFSVEQVDLLFHSFLDQASLHFAGPAPSLLIDRPGLIAILTGWCQMDGHHKRDPDHNTGCAPSTAGHAIVARTQHRTLPREAADPE